MSHKIGHLNNWPNITIHQDDMSKTFVFFGDQRKLGRKLTEITTAVETSKQCTKCVLFCGCKCNVNIWDIVQMKLG